jgi:hypothetical protein
MLRRLEALIALSACAILTSPGRGDILYQYVTDQTSYSAAAGGTVTVQLFLKETLTLGSTSLINAEGGMFAGSVGLQQTGSVPANPTIISSISTNQNPIGVGGGFGPDSGLNQTNVASDGTNAALIQTVDPLSLVFGIGPTPDANGKILLGTVTLTAGAAGTTTTFSVTSLANTSSSNPLSGPPDGGEGNTISVTSLWDLDLDNNGGHNSPFTGASPPDYFGANDITNTFTVVVAVPEPSSLLLCGLAACGGAYGAYRRRKAQAARVESG